MYIAEVPFPYDPISVTSVSQKYQQNKDELWFILELYWKVCWHE